MASTHRPILAFAVALAMLAATATSAQASVWEIGDVFANTPDGATAIKVFDNSGNFKEAVGSAGLSGEGTGCAFNANEDLYATFFQLNQTHVFANAHPHPDVQTISNPGTNESIVFDAAGNFYIGMADPTTGEYVRKYDPAGNLLDSYTNLAHDRGADWIELAADQRTLFYDGEGQTVRRYDLATHTQLPDFATIPGGEAFGVRLLPPGDGSGGALVADGVDIKRLDGAGNVIQNYDAPGVGLWFALNLDPNGTSFWSADIDTGTVYRFNIASGALEVGPIHAANEVAGLCVLGEPTAAVPRTTPASSAPAPQQAGTGTKPTIKIKGVKGTSKKKCARKGFKAKVTVNSGSQLKEVKVFIDGKLVKTTTKQKFKVKVKTKKIKRGKHKIKVTATDVAGASASQKQSFCTAAAKAKPAPRFTG